MKTTHRTTKTLYGLIAVTVIAIGFGIYRSQEKAAVAQVARPAQPTQTAVLASLRPSFDFGTISMAAGNVATSYLIKNSGDAPLTLNRIYTSCMCTTATLALPSGRKGPFGMPGHGLPTDLSASLAPGQTASLEVVFDPAAHGSAGLGRVERTVRVESKDARPLELRFVAMVKP
jgi:hypothetical protein